MRVSRCLPGEKTAAGAAATMQSDFLCTADSAIDDIVTDLRYLTELIDYY